uniref:Uncharacterized protein n=1 Tax=Arundo donax TaxID=35708 RepID=A0A0A9CBJ6_ARUDO
MLQYKKPKKLYFIGLGGFFPHSLFLSRFA